jgi:hypothetical protein
MEINAILGAPLAAFLWVQARRVGIGLDVAATPRRRKTSIGYWGVFATNR